MIAQKNQYIESAYERLQMISQDREKRLEYEAREKAILDYNQTMQEAEERGREQISRLFARLVQDKRFDVLERAANDKEFQEQLMSDYGL